MQESKKSGIVELGGGVPKILHNRQDRYLIRYFVEVMADKSTLYKLLMRAQIQVDSLVPPYKKVEAAGLDVESSGKKSQLCKAHYKEWKKETKDDRELERARYDKF